MLTRSSRSSGATVVDIPREMVDDFRGYKFVRWTCEANERRTPETIRKVSWVANANFFALATRRAGFRGEVSALLNVETYMRSVELSKDSEEAP
jgi:hypothetical protein